jgi:hypothetical protein
MPQEVWYCWKELKPSTDTEPERLITPWGDPYEYESPFDYLYKTAQEAIEAKEEAAPDEPWYLCIETLTVVGNPFGE